MRRGTRDATDAGTFCDANTTATARPVAAAAAAAAAAIGFCRSTLRLPQNVDRFGENVLRRQCMRQKLYEG